MKPIAKLFLCWAFFAVGIVESLHSQAPPGESLWTGPLLVSPGGAGREGRVGTGCPTFSWASSWSLSQQVAAYEVRVYELGAAAESQEPAILAKLPAGATAWTPELGDCLSPGRYGWAVAAILERKGEESERRWSKPGAFRVESPAAERQGPERPGHSVRPLEGRVPAGAPAAPPAGGAPAGSPPRPITGEALFTPPVCSAGGEMFADVPASDPFCRWIEQFARDGGSSGCGAGNFCPDSPVTRRQIALLFERAMRGTLTWAPSPGGPRVTTVDDQAVNSVGIDNSIAIGADGLPIISYHNPQLGVLMVAHCNDVACASGGETITKVEDPANSVGRDTSIAIGADDLPIISYIDSTALALRVAHCNDVACAGGDETITTVDDDAAINPFNTSIAIGADDLPIISYWDQAAGALRVAHCDDVACTGVNETITTVDDPPVNTVGQSSSIAIGTDTFPIISYYDYTGTALALKVAHCNDAECAGQDETITTVDDPANDVGLYSSIAIGADGLPVISYVDATAGALKVAHCNDVACEGQDETITTVDDSADVGYWNSIAIGADGLPVISYHDSTAGALKVVRCNDVACAGGNETITTVDDPLNVVVGSHTSIAIGADGVPVISYRDVTALSLKVAHCGTLSCTP